MMASLPVYATPSLGLQTNIVSENAESGNFPLEHHQAAAPIFFGQADWPGVLRAGRDLQSDVERVTGVRPVLATNGAPAGEFAVIVGTLGKNPLIDRLVKSGKLNADAISDKWESFIITTIADPLPGMNQALVVVGSDKRGTIYGIYEISEQIGVSPWYWWADVPPQHHENLFIKAGTYVQGPPVVKYRGIFINDEEPCFGPWAREKFGGINSKMYAHMFELLLRLRANLLWPAMWGKAFNEDDPLNPRVADEYGIVMGTSHHEPMIRAQAEWGKHKSQYGNGEWNYLTNEEGLKKFWTDGIERNKNYESIVTLGMRGDGDVAMPDAGGFAANKQLLEKIITDQRQILAKHMNPDVTKFPQLWALFTEVQQYYDAGLRPPDDVTLLFTDDNVGNLRRVPTPEERKRSGGAGIYFHMDMHGGPFSYQWLNSSPLPKIHEQMNLAYEYGATRIWIANVGDLKPLEVPIEFFLRMAWNPAAMTRDDVAKYQLRWAEREFGRNMPLKLPTSFRNTPNTTAGANRICSNRTRSASFITGRPNVFPQRGTTSWTRLKRCIKAFLRTKEMPITSWCSIPPKPVEIWSNFTSLRDATNSLPNKAAPAPMMKRHLCGNFSRRIRTSVIITTTYWPTENGIT